MVTGLGVAAERPVPTETADRTSALHASPQPIDVTQQSTVAPPITAPSAEGKRTFQRNTAAGGSTAGSMVIRSPTNLARLRVASEGWPGAGACHGEARSLLGSIFCRGRQ